MESGCLDDMRYQEKKGLFHEITQRSKREPSWNKVLTCNFTHSHAVLFHFDFVSKSVFNGIQLDNRQLRNESKTKEVVSECVFYCAFDFFTFSIATSLSCAFLFACNFLVTFFRLSFVAMILL
eukprot:m.199903 g.199903  ORF g.199903 m.199903 type:complete len:123 (+) comp13704_c1_seq1:262-630(+)